MLTLIHKQKARPAIFCDNCNQQITDFREALAVGVTDGLVSQVETIHRECLTTDPAVTILTVSEFLVGLLRTKAGVYTQKLG